MTNFDRQPRRRVLLATNSVAIGGLEKHVELIARHLDRRAFEVFVITPAWPATEPFSDVMAATADHHAQITPDRRYGIVGQVRESVQFYRQLRRWKIDVAHFHSTTFSGQFFAIIAARAARVKHILVTEHLAPDADLSVTARARRRFISTITSTIVCVSEKNRAARAARLWTPPERTVVVENGVDVDDIHEAAQETVDRLRSELDIAPGALVVGTAVRFEPEKGLEYLVQAFARVLTIHPTAVLVMVGDGSLRGELGDLAESLGVARSVRWCGFQSDPNPYVCVMDVFVLPVPVGSMSIGLLEAMAMRRAVVITFGGKGEAVEDGVNGYCATPREADSIAECVERLLADAALRTTFGEAARARVVDAFSATRVASRLSELYLGSTRASLTSPVSAASRVSSESPVDSPVLAASVSAGGVAVQPPTSFETNSIGPVGP